MELELGLKIIRTRDDVSSSTDFRLSRDSLGHLSLTRETDTVFILTLHLKGFKKEGIDIEINKEGNRIKISGRKELEEMVLIKWVEWKKKTQVYQIMKVFQIPEIVNLDKIKARFSEEDWTLTVTFPKKVKGISGLKIEEEEEDEEKTEPEPEEEIKEETKEEEDRIEEEEELMKEEETMDDEEEKEEIKEEESKPKKKKRKKCGFPFFAGSTLLMSIIVFIIQLIQSRRK